MLENLRALAPKTFVLDGELVIPVDGALSFDALQMRLHPAASRIERLSKETPATFIVFDCLLRKARQSLLLEAFEQRRAVLEAIFKELALEDVLDTVVNAFPSAREAATLKADLVSCGRSEFSLIPAADPLDTLRFLVAHPDGMTFFCWRK